MARLSRRASPSILTKDLRNPVMFIVDMINGFAKEGALADPEISKIASPIKELAINSNAKIWFINDNHSEDAKEFERFPKHCLANTKEAEIVDELKDLSGDLLTKNAISAASSPQFNEMLETLPKENTDLIVTGCCSDLCVLQLALPLQSWINQNNLKGMRVIVPEDCIETYDIPELHDAKFWNEVSLDNMAANGIEIVGSVIKEKD